MKLILIIIAMSIAGCSSIPHWQKYGEAKKNFRYRRDVADEWVRYDSVSESFIGDCEDMAFSLQHQIGGKVMRVIYKSLWHAVLVTNGYVYDNIMKYPVAVEAYEGLIINEMVYE
jgi:hypothetical protein